MTTATKIVAHEHYALTDTAIEQIKRIQLDSDTKNKELSGVFTHEDKFITGFHVVSTGTDGECDTCSDIHLFHTHPQSISGPSDADYINLLDCQYVVDGKVKFGYGVVSTDAYIMGYTPTVDLGKLAMSPDVSLDELKTLLMWSIGILHAALTRDYMTPVGYYTNIASVDLKLAMALAKLPGVLDRAKYEFKVRSTSMCSYEEYESLANKAVWAGRFAQGDIGFVIKSLHTWPVSFAHIKDESRDKIA